MDDGEVRRIEVALAQAGWAEHVRLEREFRVWSRLAQEVNDYTATVDDYTNDLCSRDYIAEFAARASSGLRTAVEEVVSPGDETFRGATVEDHDARLGRYFRIDQESAWWWHRRPSSGPLLTSSPSSNALISRYPRALSYVPDVSDAPS